MVQCLDCNEAFDDYYGDYCPFCGGEDVITLNVDDRYVNYEVEEIDD